MKKLLLDDFLSHRATSRAGLLSAALTAAVPLAGASAQAQDRPNILFILADDIGHDGVGCYGAADYAGLTPRIDELASRSMRFTQCHASAVCSPSRAQYLTGQYPFRNGVLTNSGNNYHDPDKPTVSKVLLDAGYQTGAAGKDVADTFTYMDENDNRMIFMEEYLDGGTGAYWDYKQYETKGPSGIDPSKYPYFPDAMQAFVLDFLERHQANAAAGEPFYLFYSLMHPHGPYHPTPDSAPGTSDRRELYADYLRYMDKLVGGVLDKLDELKLADNTLLVFVGDNGCQGGTQGKLRDPRSGEIRSISGRKSDDEELREGATLVPLIVRWPAKIKEPSVQDCLVDFTDFLVTFADATGASIPSNWTADGYSFAPLLRGEADWQPRPWAFAQFQYNWWVRGPQFRLNRDGRLFDMADAPFSMTEIRPENDTPASAAARKSLQAVLDELDPANGPTYEAFMDSAYNKTVWSWKEKNWDWAKRWEKKFSGDQADPDGDGVPNLFERAFDWDPNNGSDSMPKPAFKSGSGEIEMPAVVSESDVVITVVKQDGTLADGSEKPGDLRFHAERAMPWKMPPELKPNRPAVVK